MRSILFFGLTAMASTSALAQTSAEASGEIIVTATLKAYEPSADLATRTGTPSLELPFVSDAVGAALIADRGLTSLTDALRTVPGTAPVAGIGNFNTRFRLRGFVATNNLRNGFRQALGFTTTDVAHIDRNEVLKGPASALYGRFEPGGVVNIVTKQPLLRDRYAASVTADEDGQLRGTLDLNWAASDAVQARVNAAYDNGKGFRDFVDNRTYFIAPSVAIAIGPETRLIVEGEYSDRDGVFDRGFVTSPLLRDLPPSRFLGKPAHTYRNRTTAASAMLEHGALDTLRLRVGGSYSRSRSDGFYFFPVAGGTGVPLLSATGILNRRIQTTFDIQRDWTAMAEVAARIATGNIEHSVLAAAEYNRDSGVSVIRRSTVNSSISIFAPIYGAARPAPTAGIVDTAARNSSIAGLLQLETSWTPWLRTTVGARYERLKSRFTDNLTVRAGVATETAFTPGAGVTILPGSGFEIDVAAQPVPELRFELAYAYIDAEVTRDAILLGRKLQSTPEHSASFWARWDFHPRFGAGVGVFLVSDRFVDTQNSFALDGYARADAALYWTPIVGVQVQLNLLNAFGSRYFENGNTNNNFYPGQPRTVRASVSFAL